MLNLRHRMLVSPHNHKTLLLPMEPLLLMRMLLLMNPRRLVLYRQK